MRNFFITPKVFGLVFYQEWRHYDIASVGGTAAGMCFSLCGIFALLTAHRYRMHAKSFEDGDRAKLLHTKYKPDMSDDDSTMNPDGTTPADAQGQKKSYYTHDMGGTYRWRDIS